VYGVYLSIPRRAAVRWRWRDYSVEAAIIEFLVHMAAIIYTHIFLVTVSHS